MKQRLAVINGSYNRDGLTARCLGSRSAALAEELGIGKEEVAFIFPDNDIRSCIGCKPGKCVIGCRFDYGDGFGEIAAAIQNATAILIGSPVYLDMPTPKIMALLCRLNCYAENTKREFFRGKRVYLHANGFCSGTKSTIAAMMGACEMLGFDIPGRSTTEYIIKWEDKKIRGGMDPGCWLKP